LNARAWDQANSMDLIVSVEPGALTVKTGFGVNMILIGIFIALLPWSSLSSWSAGVPRNSPDRPQVDQRPGLPVGKRADQRLHPHARLFHSRLGHPQNPLGEMDPLAPAASSHLSGLGHGRGPSARLREHGIDSEPRLGI